MAVLIVICGLVLATAVVLLISSPLRAAQRGPRSELPGEGGAGEPEGPGAPEQRDELEAAREAKYREIRDAELDYRTGKLSAADFGAIDDQLRAEALAILNRLEALAEPGADEAAGP